MPTSPEFEAELSRELEAAPAPGEIAELARVLTDAVHRKADAGQLVRLLWRLVWFLITHPVLDAVVALVVFDWLYLGWPGVVVLVVFVVALLVTFLTPSRRAGRAERIGCCRRPAG